MDENEISRIIVDRCLKIHKALGPEFLESVKEEVLFNVELIQNGITRIVNKL